jgi:clan AA aspartic protease
MGLVKVDAVLSNPEKPKLKPVPVQALVGTGAITLCIPEHVRIQLDLQEAERREVTVANGKKEVVPYVGPVKITCLGRSRYAGALVLGDRVLLGAVPMQDMDLVISPTREQVTPNPESPNIRAGAHK